MLSDTAANSFPEAQLAIAYTSHYLGKKVHAGFSCRMKALQVHNNLKECQGDSTSWNLGFLGFLFSFFP